MPSIQSFFLIFFLSLIANSANITLANFAMSSLGKDEKSQFGNSCGLILDRYQSLKRIGPARLEDGSDVALACMNIIFQSWNDLFSSASNGQPSDFFDLEQYKNLKTAREEALDEISSIYDFYRPGLIPAIRDEMTRMRSQKLWPELPDSLKFDDIQETSYTRQMKLCSDPRFIQAVQEKSARPEMNREVTRTINREFYVQDASVGVNAIYVPTEKRKVTVTYSSYAEWLKSIRKPGIF